MNLEPCHTSSICILVWLLVEHINYCNKYHIQKCGTYWREVFISMRIPDGAALSKGWHLFEGLATCRIQ